MTTPEPGTSSPPARPPRRWRRWAVRVALTLLLALSVTLVGFGMRLGPMGSAYQGKLLAGGVFVSGRDADAVLAADLDPDELSPLLGLCASELDAEGARVHTAFVGIEAAEVRYREGLGTTVVIGELAEVAPPAPVPAPSDPSAPWPEGAAVDVDLLPEARAKREALEALLDEAFSEPGPERPRRTRGLVIVWRGRIVAERYAPGFDPETPQLGWSMTKTFVAALAGVLVREGRWSLERGLEVPEWSAEDPRAAITLQQLLQMQSGLEFAEDYSPLTDVTRMLFCERDAGGFAASKPLAHPPGSAWSYSSGTTNLICRAMRAELGDAYASFPRDALFAPLGMRSALIELDSAGHFVGSSFGWATPRDWARFGLLWVQDGVWRGERILPEGWVDWCREPAEHSNGRYGGHVWLRLAKPGQVPELPADTFHAAGHDRQLLTMIPSQQLVVVRLGLTRDRGSWIQERFVADVLATLAD